MSYLLFLKLLEEMFFTVFEICEYWWVLDTLWRLNFSQQFGKQVKCLLDTAWANLSTLHKKTKWAHGFTIHPETESLWIQIVAGFLNFSSHSWVSSS